MFIFMKQHNGRRNKKTTTKNFNPQIYRKYFNNLNLNYYVYP